MSHDYHEGHPRYSEAQILHDGCQECTQRSERPDVAIAYLDPASFAGAWVRAAAFQHGDLADVSEAEVPVLRILSALQVQFERISGLPVGKLPIPLVVTA